MKLYSFNERRFALWTLFLNFPLIVLTIVLLVLYSPTEIEQSVPVNCHYQVINGTNECAYSDSTTAGDNIGCTIGTIIFLFLILCTQIYIISATEENQCCICEPRETSCDRTGRMSFMQIIQVLNFLGLGIGGFAVQIQYLNQDIGFGASTPLSYYVVFWFFGGALWFAIVALVLLFALIRWTVKTVQPFICCCDCAGLWRLCWDTPINDRICCMCLAKIPASQYKGLVCQHGFHRTCIDRYQQKHGGTNCPECRSPIVVQVNDI